MVEINIDIIYVRYEYRAEELKKIAKQCINENPGKDYWDIAKILLDKMEAIAKENGIPEKFLNEGKIGYNLQSMFGTVKFLFQEMELAKKPSPPLSFFLPAHPLLALSLSKGGLKEEKFFITK